MRALRTIVALSAVTLVTASLAGCKDDGRALRPARADQNGSVSSLATPTTTIDPVFTDVDLDIGDVTTLPTEIVEASLVTPFGDDQVVPDRYTCNGENVSPALSWTAAPESAVEIAISMTDSDAGGYVHWVMSGLDPTTTSLEAGEVPEGAIVGINDGGTSGYTGPCPPAGGGEHRYVITVHFMSQVTELSSGASGDDLLAFVQGATYDGASAVVTYEQA